jgi:hypothetical protein
MMRAAYIVQVAHVALMATNPDNTPPLESEGEINPFKTYPRRTEVMHPLHAAMVVAAIDRDIVWLVAPLEFDDPKIIPYHPIHIATAPTLWNKVLYS